MAPEQNKRQVAYKVRIAEITNGKYIKKEGWEPNIIITPSGKEVARINIIGTVISTNPEDFNSITIDDGSDNISIRAFDNSEIMKKLVIGDIILIIGRPREYSNSIYIIPEIIKKIDNIDWIHLRKLELGEISISSQQIEEPETKIIESNKPEVEEIKIEEEPFELSEDESDMQKIYNLIKQKDIGEGINTEEIIQESKIENAEKIINNLLMEGEIFEISPGKIKVLE